MATKASNVFDRLPDEIIEYIFLLITYSPPIEPSNHTIDLSSGLFYFSYTLHKPYLRCAFKDLTAAERVCQRFYSILRSQAFWRRKCQQDHVVIVNEQLAIKQDADFRRLYFSNPFHPDFNLVAFQNVTSSNEANRHTTSSSMNYIRNSLVPSFFHKLVTQKNPGLEIGVWRPKIDVEKIPIGCDILYDAFKQISPCYVTSYEWASYELANIPLIRQGQEKVPELRTMIEFSICTAGRWDCSYRYKLKLSFSNGHIWNYNKDVNDGDNRWHRITYRYGGYLKGQQPPKVSMEIHGRDGRYWAGNYGTKFAQIRLRLVLRDENNQVEEENEEILKEPEICNHDEYHTIHP